MRPCNNCGDPIENRLLYRASCEADAPPKTVPDSIQDDRVTRPTLSKLVWLMAEIALRTVIIACPIAVVLGLILTIALPVVIALAVAGFVGLTAALGWTLLEMHFQSGPH